MFLEVQSREESFLQQHFELLPRRDYSRSRPIQRDNTTMSMHRGRKPFGQKQYFHLDNSIELEQSWSPKEEIEVFPRKISPSSFNSVIFLREAAFIKLEPAFLSHVELSNAADWRIRVLSSSH
jgi:hypothetical protein